MPSTALSIASSNCSQLTDLATLCKAAADPLRLNVLRVLKADSFGVLELCTIFDMAQPKLSHHLKVLANAGLVATRREGNSIFYRRPLIDLEVAGAGLVQALLAEADSQPIDTGLLTKIQAIKAERSTSSLNFFAKHANRFDEKQELVTESSHYVANVHDLIEHTQLPDSATVIEIGPGKGELLADLARQFDHLYAVDNAPEMLKLARQTINDAKLDNVSFVLGDPEVAVNQHIQGDLLIYNMVLHHIASPAEVFPQSAQLLNDQGYLLIAELCHHDQHWVTESCGDIWLGFEAHELHSWATSAGLEQQQSLFLGLRNGFQIQLHLYQKGAHPRS